MQLLLHKKMSNKKNIALFYGRNKLNEARIEYMPFVLNFIKCLDKDDYNVDVFLAENKTSAYSTLFSKNVTVHFIDHDFIWNRRRGRKFFYYALILIKLWLLKRKFNYNMIVGAGVFGNFVAAQISKQKKIKYLYLGDEFPILYGDFWNTIDKKNCEQADLVIVPDETRIEGTEKLLGKKLKNAITLPNSPLKSDIENLPEINWHEKLKIDANKKVILYAGGVEFFNQILDVLIQLPKLSSEYVLLIIAPEKYKKEFEYYLITGKSIWHSEFLKDAEFYSLIKQSFASIGLYRTDIGMLDYIGKSSGKIMRSIACGTPVIATKTNSLNFIDELNLGVCLTNTCFFIEGIEEINIKHKQQREACLNSFYSTLCYDVYWAKLKEDHLNDLLK